MSVVEFVFSVAKRLIYITFPIKYHRFSICVATIFLLVLTALFYFVTASRKGLTAEIKELDRGTIRVPNTTLKRAVFVQHLMKQCCNGHAQFLN